ncbi:hypothetical protein ACFXKG_28380 [Streptomyces sp. NPDC059255]|uniref:hypothetical protein n=1 Tax=Streptomyces sp. NPDC059255 TaxID=3346793 RepID=UPI0036B5B3AB
MDPRTHFVFRAHPEHGFVASATPSVSGHLAHWYLTREQFEPVPDAPGLFRLAEPDREGARRTRQAVHDLRRHGFTVVADVALDPAASPGPPPPLLRNGLLERRSRLARASAGRTTQHDTASAGPVPPKPSYAPTVHLNAPASGRSR